MTPEIDSALTWLSPHGRRFGIRRIPIGPLILGVLLLFIAAVSVHDTAPVVLNHEVILQFEKKWPPWKVSPWDFSYGGGFQWQDRIVIRGVVTGTLMFELDQMSVRDEEMETCHTERTRCALPHATGNVFRRGQVRAAGMFP